MSRRAPRGQVFDAVASEYDRVRRGYPPELIDTAFAYGSLSSGEPVVEVGCGTGKLTTELVERGLQVDAVDPGARLVELARSRVRNADAVRFHVARFEDVALPEAVFAAVFSATAFHWIDPSVGWSKAAGLLREDGMLALLTHIGVSDASEEITERLLSVYRDVVPEATGWRPRDSSTLLEGAEARRGDVSALWSWVTHRELQAPEAASLFGDVRIETVSIEAEETTRELLDLTKTTSTYLQLDLERRRALEKGIAAVLDEFGGVHHFRMLVVLALARRR